MLDEPTNHLDLEMRQALTDALTYYEGSLVVVSHDRHLLRSTVNEFYLVHDKKVEEFKGDLDDYQKWLNEQNSLELAKSSENSTASVAENKESASNRKEQKRLEAELRQQTAPLRKKITQLEKDLDKASTQLAELETLLASSEIYEAENKAKLTETLAKQVEAMQKVEQIEMEWLEAQEQLEFMLNGE